MAAAVAGPIPGACCNASFEAFQLRSADRTSPRAPGAQRPPSGAPGRTPSGPPSVTAGRDDSPVARRWARVRIALLALVSSRPGLGAESGDDLPAQGNLVTDPDLERGLVVTAAVAVGR